MAENNEESKLPQEPEPQEPEPEPEPYHSEQSIRNQMIQSEDRVARRRLFTEIYAYYRSVRFGAYLKTNGFVEDLNTCTLEEMKGLLEDIRFAIQNRGGSDMIQKAVPNFLYAAEPIISPYYDITGLTVHLCGTETFKDLVEELALENQIFSNTKASTRLCYEVVRAATIVHGINANKPAEKPVSLSAKHSDLV